MSETDVFADKAQLLADLEMIEISRWYRKEFVDRLVAASKSQEEDVLSTLRLESALGDGLICVKVTVVPQPMSHSRRRVNWRGLLARRL